MKLISHRGNLEGRIPSMENHPDYIIKSIKLGYDVEIDLRYINNKFYLGHDNPEYEIDVEWIKKHSTNLWVHCKNLQCVSKLYREKYSLNYFWHEQDKVTLTSMGYIWAYPGLQKIKGSIAVLPELYNDDITDCIGLCSDFIKNYNNI